MNPLISMVRFCCALVFFTEVAFFVDFFSFEWIALFQFLGWGGVYALVLLNTFLIFFASGLFFKAYQSYQNWIKWSVISIYTCTICLFILMMDWMFRSDPFSSKIVYVQPITSAVLSKDFNNFSLVKKVSPNNKAEIQSIYDRIIINSPDIYLRHPIGSTIDKYADKYQVDPLLLFYLVFVNSFYGEAEAGPIPFFKAMTPETVRDLVQVHLPGWFVESAFRKMMIHHESPIFSIDRDYNFKTRYVFHKATLDVSSQPYDLNTFSDVLMIMQEYPGEFLDLSLEQGGSSLDQELSDAFNQLRGNALVKPYEVQSGLGYLNKNYYSEHRLYLKKFARAAYYKSALDFDFSTRVMALVIKYHRDYYLHRLGSDAWSRLPMWQQAAMTVMARDLFTPGVGKPSYNLYAIPEINCASIEYLASQAYLDHSIMTGSIASIWRPANPEFLWAGAAYRLRVFNQLWYIVHNQQIPGLPREAVISIANKTLTRH